MKTFAEYREQRQAANEKLGDLYMKAANRELTDEEKMQEINLSREIRQCEDGMRAINLENENARSAAADAEVTKRENFRACIKDVRNGKRDREITLAVDSTAPKANITSSGAINLTIHDLIPTLEEGLGLPAGLNIVTGVIGNEVWPVSVDDVEMEEVGEVAPLNDQVLNFDQIVPVSYRTGLTVPVSNRAIDNASFDLMGFVQAKFEKAQRRYLAKKIYAHTPFTGNKGPVAGVTATSLTISTADAYKNILEAIAAFKDKGFIDSEICLTMSAKTEADLKATPKAAGQGGFIIENGLCCGYPYTVSHYVNLGGTAAAPALDTNKEFLLIGCWEWFALQQHDEVRLTIDATSQAVAKKNITAITLNTAWSMTDLSAKLNGASTTQAFALYELA